MNKKELKAELAAKKAAIRDIKRTQSTVFCMYSTDEVVAPNQQNHPINYCNSY